MRVSDHAISRWRERIKMGSKADDATIIRQIQQRLAIAVPVRLRSASARIGQLTAHGAPATHLRAGDAVLVLVDGVVTSVYWYDKVRWEAIPKEGVK